MQPNQDNIGRKKVIETSVFCSMSNNYRKVARNLNLKDNN